MKSTAVSAVMAAKKRWLIGNLFSYARGAPPPLAWHGLRCPSAPSGDSPPPGGPHPPTRAPPARPPPPRLARPSLSLGLERRLSASGRDPPHDLCLRRCRGSALRPTTFRL